MMIIAVISNTSILLYTVVDTVYLWQVLKKHKTVNASIFQFFWASKHTCFLIQKVK